MPLSELVSAERVTAWARAVRGTWWAPIAVVLVYTPSAFVMFPRPLLTVIAFGPWLGFGYGMARILLSALGVLGAELAVRGVAAAYARGAAAGVDSLPDPCFEGETWGL